MWLGPPSLIDITYSFPLWVQAVCIRSQERVFLHFPTDMSEPAKTYITILSQTHRGIVFNLCVPTHISGLLNQFSHLQVILKRVIPNQTNNKQTIKGQKGKRNSRLGSVTVQGLKRKNHFVNLRLTLQIRHLYAWSWRDCFLCQGLWPSVGEAPHGMTPAGQKERTCLWK